MINKVNTPWKKRCWQNNKNIVNNSHLINVYVGDLGFFLFIIITDKKNVLMASVV